MKIIEKIRVKIIIFKSTNMSCKFEFGGQSMIFKSLENIDGGI